MRYDREHGPLYRQPPNIRAARSLTIPAGVGPHVRLFFAEMKRQGRSYYAMAEASGVTRASQKAWRKKNYPSLTSIEAALGALGWSFLPVPVVEILPPDVAGDLAAMAARMQTGLPEVWSAVIAAGLQQRDKREQAAIRLAKIDAARETKAIAMPKPRPAA